jgi:hypothetical protein
MPTVGRLLTNINTIWQPDTRVGGGYTTSTFYPGDAHCQPKSRHTTLHHIFHWR